MGPSATFVPQMRQVPLLGVLVRPGELRELRARDPQVGEDAPVEQRAQELDRRPLRADHVCADQALDHLEVAQPPQRRPLVQLGRELRALP